MKLQELMIKLTHWAWAACGNGSNAKWPDKICECALNYKMETRTIECVAFFYNEGAKRDDFIQKISFDAVSIPVSGEVWWSYASTFGKSYIWFIHELI